MRDTNVLDISWFVTCDARGLRYNVKYWHNHSFLKHKNPAPPRLCNGTTFSVKLNSLKLLQFEMGKFQAEFAVRYSNSEVYTFSGTTRIFNDHKDNRYILCAWIKFRLLTWTVWYVAVCLAHWMENLLIYLCTRKSASIKRIKTRSTCIFAARCMYKNKVIRIMWCSLLDEFSRIRYLLSIISHVCAYLRNRFFFFFL